MTLELKYILIFIGASIFPVLLFFVVDFNPFQLKGLLASYAISIVVLLLAGLEKRSHFGGFIDYGTGLKTLLIVSLAGGVVSLLLTCFLWGGNTLIGQHNLAATKSSAEFQINLISKISSQSKEELSLEADRTIEEAMENESILKTINDPYAFRNFPILLVSAVIGYLFLSLFLAIFIKRKQKIST